MLVSAFSPPRMEIEEHQVLVDLADVLNQPYGKNRFSRSRDAFGPGQAMATGTLHPRSADAICLQ